MEFRKRIFVCSALRGDVKTNVELTKRYCRWGADKGFAVYAPHLYLPLFLNDDDEHERDLGISSGLSYLSTCEELWAFCVNGRISQGMTTEIETAFGLGIPVRFHAVYLEPVDILGSPWKFEEVIFRLDHLPPDLMPEPEDLVTAKTSAQQTAKLLGNIEKHLKNGGFYEDFDEQLDQAMGTELRDRDRATEVEWQAVRDGATD